jgi:hypothetical protein
VGTKVLDPLRICVKVANWCDPSYVVTLTCVKTLEICVERVLPRYPNDSQYRIVFFCFGEDD